MSEKPSQDKLLIDKGTWHYKYYIAIRRFWGAQKEPAITSLCPYFQTMVWATVLLFLMLPIIILGWILTKLTRLFYKFLVCARFNRLVDLLDKSLLMDLVDAGSFAAAPGLATIMVAGVMGAIISLSGMVVYGLYHGALHIHEFPEAMWWLLLNLSSLLFFACSLIGCVEFYLLKFLFQFLSNGNMWSTFFFYLGYFLCFVLFFLGLFQAWIIFSGTKIGQAVVGWLTFQLNGFEKARTVARTRRLIQLEEKTRRIESGIEEEKPPCAIKKFFSWVRSFFSQTLPNGNKVLGPIGILWELLYGIKNKACPIIEFVDKKPEDEEEAQPGSVGSVAKKNKKKKNKPWK